MDSCLLSGNVGLQILCSCTLPACRALSLSCTRCRTEFVCSVGAVVVANAAVVVAAAIAAAGLAAVAIAVAAAAGVAVVAIVAAAAAGVAVAAIVVAAAAGVVAVVVAVNFVDAVVVSGDAAAAAVGFFYFLGLQSRWNSVWPFGHCLLVPSW